MHLKMPDCLSLFSTVFCFVQPHFLGLTGCPRPPVTPLAQMTEAMMEQEVLLQHLMGSLDISGWSVVLYFAPVLKEM